MISAKCYNCIENFGYCHNLLSLSTVCGTRALWQNGWSLCMFYASHCISLSIRQWSVYLYTECILWFISISYNEPCVHDEAFLWDNWYVKSQDNKSIYWTCQQNNVQKNPSALCSVPSDLSNPTSVTTYSYMMTATLASTFGVLLRNNLAVFFVVPVFHHKISVVKLFVPKKQDAWPFDHNSDWHEPLFNFYFIYC